MVALPWDALGDAYERLADAERHGTADDVDAAQVDVERAKDHLAGIGNLLACLALDEAGSPLQRKLVRVFTASSEAAWDKALRASRRASWAINELSVLQDRVTQLEELVARLTHGVGEPLETKQ